MRSTACPPGHPDQIRLFEHRGKRLRNLGAAEVSEHRRGGTPTAEAKICRRLPDVSAIPVIIPPFTMPRPCRVADEPLLVNSNLV